MIAWPEYVNKTILNGTNGQFPNAIIGDTMRSGRSKSRLRASNVGETFSVSMQFSKEELELFRAWYRYNLRLGALTFAFPTIAGTGETEYRIIPSPSWVPNGGNYVLVSMQWEEVI